MEQVVFFVFDQQERQACLYSLLLYDSDWERSEGGCGDWIGEETTMKALVDGDRFAATKPESPDREPDSLLLL